MRESADTRSRLIEAAIVMIDEGGEGSVRLRDIGTTAGVTLPSIYHFFGNRDGLIEQAQAARYLRTQLGIARAFSDAVFECRSRRSFVATVRRFLSMALDNARAPLRSVRIEVLGSAQSRPRLAALLIEQQRAANEAFAAPLRHAQRRGWMRQDIDANTVAAWVLSMVSGRLFVESDPSFDGLSTWDALSIEAILAALEPSDSTGRPSATT